ncbi:MAG: AAA family ATPase [Deltaproteobacteria bacterium]|nr:AAA family ATPase [Deltaproteobacteria bacterium]
MYTSYFGFKENPFSLTPDPNYLYLSRHHKEAFDHLLYGINERKGFIVITGGVGTGKTTLCRALLGTLDSSTKTALIFNAYLSDIELLRTINEEFGIDTNTEGQSKKDHIDGLNRFLLETHSRGGNAVLLIDEAQNLSHAVLEQIRMLSNLETEKEKLVQIVLAGQLELRDVLASPALKQLDERIMVRYDLKPLEREDVRGYVEHRLVIAGGKGNVRFTKGALEALYASSQGNPRRINGVCDRALLIAYSKDESTISKKTMQKAIEDVRGDVAARPAQRSYWSQKKAIALSVLLVLLLVMVGGIGGWTLRREIAGLVTEEQASDTIRTVPENKGHSELLPVEQESVAVKGDTIPSPPAEPGRGLAGGLLLDEQTSLGELFKRFNPEDQGGRKVHLGLYTFHTDPEYYIMFKKPFRVRVNAAAGELDPGSAGGLNSPQYLLIKEVIAKGAIAVDVNGNEHLIDRSFILTHWDGEVCWVYPYENNDDSLARGMSGLPVIKLQRALDEIGYSVKPIGLYDQTTHDQVMRFQGDFSLKADGIVGTRTKGLLYQMSNELYP